jgi:CHRD domain-containing protein
MRKLYAFPAVLVVALTVATTALSQPLARTFAVQLTAADEVPECAATNRSDRGVALFRIIDPAGGTVEYRVISTNLPGEIVGSPGIHIHGPASAGSTAPVLQPLTPTGAEVGIVAAGTFSNPALVAAALENPELYYVNVHTTVCPEGAVRGQLGT